MAALLPTPPAPLWFGTLCVQQAGGQWRGMLSGVLMHLGCGSVQTGSRWFSTESFLGGGFLSFPCIVPKCLSPSVEGRPVGCVSLAWRARISLLPCRLSSPHPHVRVP